MPDDELDDEALDDEELDEDGVDWIEDDLDASEGVGPEGSGYVRPPARRRWGTLLAFAVLIGSAGAIYPGITLIAFLVIVVVIRTIGLSVESMHAHRSGSASVAPTTPGPSRQARGTSCGRCSDSCPPWWSRPAWW